MQAQRISFRTKHLDFTRSTHRCKVLATHTYPLLTTPLHHPALIPNTNSPHHLSLHHVHPHHHGPPHPPRHHRLGNRHSPSAPQNGSTLPTCPRSDGSRRRATSWKTATGGSSPPSCAAWNAAPLTAGLRLASTGSTGRRWRGPREPRARSASASTPSSWKMGQSTPFQPTWMMRGSNIS
jgi:hypothetical protein